ncbi:MAG: RHS repeat-associated core domain-containing protein [Lachnospiraceae bacterium]
MNYHDNRYSNLTEERHGEQVLKNYVYDAANRMISGTNLVTGRKSEYTYNGLLARVKKTSDAIVSTYIPDYIGGMHNDLVTQVSGFGTVNAAFGHGYSRVSQRFIPEAGVSIPAADTYFQPDLYGSPLFAADADGMIKHRADHDLWGMPKNACEDSAIGAGLRFTTYEYDPVLEKHFAHAGMYDPAQGRMLGTDPVKRGLNGYAYCGNDPVNQTDPTGEIANVLVGGILGAAAGGIIGGAFGFAGSALSQLAEGKGFNARKAWGAAANGAIVGAARGALTGSGVGIPAALGVNFAAGMAGSLAEQRLAGERMSPMRAAVDGAFNALGGRIYGTSPLRNAKDAFIRGALEGAVKGGAYNIADVLDNKLRNAYGPKKPAVRKPQNLRGVQPTRSRCPQKECEKARPFAGMKYAGKDGRGGSLAPRNDRFSLGRFVRDVAVGAVMGGLASVAFYGAGKGVEALRNSVRRKIRKPVFDGSLSLVFGNNDKAISDTAKIVLPTTREKFVVIGHGDPEGIMINGKVEKAWEVAVRVRNSEEFIGGRQIVQLYCCETGKYSNGFAQQLADILGVTVKAPNKKVYPLNGRVVVGYKYKDAITGINKWDPGDWIEFIPKTIILRRKGR